MDSWSTMDEPREHTHAELIAQLATSQQALQRSEQRTKMLAQLISDYAYVYLLFPDGHIQYEWTTEALISISGYSREELAAIGWEALLYEPDALEVARRYEAIRSGREDVRIWKVLLKDGRVRLLRDTCIPVRDEEIGAIRVFGASQDITEQYEAEQRVRQERSRLEVTFEAITDGVLVYDAQEHVLHYNTAMNKLFDLDHYPAFRTLAADELTLRLQARDEKNRPVPRGKGPLTRVLHGEVLTNERAVDVRISTFAGRDLLVSVSGAPMYDEQHQLIGAVLVVRDVTARREQERRTAEALEAILAMAGAMVEFPQGSERPENAVTVYLHSAASRLLDLTCNLLHCRTAAILAIQNGSLEPVALIGLAPEVRERFWREFSPICLDVYYTVSEQAQALQGESFLVDLGMVPGATLPSYGVNSVLAAPIRIGTQLIGLLALDHANMQHSYPLKQESRLIEAIARLAALVIERERLLQERVVAQASELALRESNRRLDDFLSMASHELRSPLTTIKASIQMARRLFQRRAYEMPLEQLLGRLDEMLSRAEHQVGVETRLVNDLLDVSRIQNNKLELHLQPLDLSDLVREVVTDQQTSVYPSTFQLHLPEDAAVKVMADRDRIGQVLNNFLTNAVKYALSESAITITLAAQEGEARVAVSDTGPGLTPEQQERIWDRFYQIAAHRTTGAPGLGLGLYISQTIVQQHAGRIGVESEPGRGSTFWFSLPILPEG